MRDSVGKAIDLREDLDCNIYDYGYGHLHGNEEEQIQPCVGEEHRAQEQKSKYAAGGSDDRNIDHSLNYVEQIAHHSAEYSADEIEEQKFPCPEIPFQGTSEHQKRKHVEEQVPEISVYEHIGHELPDPAHVDASGNQTHPIDEPQTLDRKVRIVGDQEHQDVGQNQIYCGIRICVFELSVQEAVFHY